MQTIGSPVLWGSFLAFVLAMLALDLGVFHRRAHVVGLREAAQWTAVWVALALSFNGLVWYVFGARHALEFLAGYLIEKSLSIDNMFVFVVIFSSLKIPPSYQHKVLFWGILTAVALRGALILAGAALLERFEWLMYLFGAFLVFTGGRLLVNRHEESAPQTGLWLRLARRIVPTTTRLDGPRFFTVEQGRRVATPLLVALLLVEISDVVFAVDSIPAVFGVTRDPFIVFTSNIFAILGLRAMFFLLADLVHRFRYLKVGLAFVLAFVGGKMLMAAFVEISPLPSLLVIMSILAVSVLWSWRAAQREGGSRPGESH